MRLLRDGRWKLTDAEAFALSRDKAFRKASALVFLWGGASGGDRRHPEVRKASRALGEAIDSWIRRRRRSPAPPPEGR